MERKPMPPRRTPLPRGESELKRTGLKRSTPLRSTPSPNLSGTSLSRAARTSRRQPLRVSRPKVSREEVEARRLVRQRSGSRCELGWVCAGDEWATDYAHRQARSQGGPFDAANAGDSCRACHAAAHAAPDEARRRGWSVRRGHDFRAIPVQHARHGLVLLHSDGSWTPISEIPDEESA